MITYEIYPTRFGEVGIAAGEEGLVALEFHRERPLPIEADWQRRSSPLTDRAARQLQEYFSGERRDFDLPLAPAAPNSSAVSGTHYCAFPTVRPAATASRRRRSAT
ncbi:methylated-DNA--[protein]-cysteine S-methyltransferase [Microbulbifer taiwanensis]|uniref:methylated-DNA--[protein]-cysteine S-methyltransferase n=1 Tax=Microbulbifer taiwanensis TaxID=986746 RepID=UPI0036135F2D